MRSIASFFIICIFMSHGSLAQKINIDSVKAELHKSIPDTSKVINYRILAGTLRLSNPSEAIIYGKKGAELGKRIGFDKGIAGCYLNVSACYTSVGKLDSALLYIDTAIVYSHKAGDPNRLALAYLNRADYYMQLQNFDQSLKDCDTSMKYAEQANSDDRRARVLQTIGSIYFYQKLYDQSVEYYNKADVLYKKINNLQMSAIVLNNLATIYKNKGDYPKAAADLLQAIAIADSLNDRSNLSLYHGTLSDVYYNQGAYAQAERSANTAMQYAKEIKNELSTGTAWELLGQVYMKQGKTAEGIEALSNSYAIFKKLEDVNKIQSTTGLLSEAYAATGNYAKAFEYQNLSRIANDTLVKHRYDDDIAAMQARFKVDEKDREIKLLDQDRQLKEQKLRQQRILFIGSAVITVLALAGIIMAISRYRLRNRMRELELRNQIAADLHDEIGSSLSSIHMLSQMAAQKQTNTSSDELFTRVGNHAKETMEKMSDLVWMINPGANEGADLVQRMQRFMHEMCGETDIETVLQVTALEKTALTMQQRKDIYLIFKEALNNALKYANARRIEVTARVDNSNLVMEIKDDGKGFDTTQPGKGNGLRNLKHRSKELGGTLEIISAAGKGTNVRLTMPA